MAGEEEEEKEDEEEYSWKKFARAGSLKVPGKKGEGVLRSTVHLLQYIFMGKGTIRKPRVNNELAVDIGKLHATCMHAYQYQLERER